jgi:hypothetical protein
MNPSGALEKVRCSAGFGDLLATAHWLFVRPGISDLLTRRLGKNRNNGYRTALTYPGGWILFLAPFTSIQTQEHATSGKVAA